MRNVRSLLLRASCLAAILFAAFSSTRASPAAASESCYICLNTNTCPWDLSIYDSQCNSLCGGGSYAGACSFLTACEVWEGSPSNAAVLCYFAG